jgi:hypothetical protein
MRRRMQKTVVVDGRERGEGEERRKRGGRSDSAR